MQAVSRDTGAIGKTSSLQLAGRLVALSLGPTLETNHCIVDDLSARGLPAISNVLNGQKVAGEKLLGVFCRFGASSLVP